MFGIFSTALGGLLLWQAAGGAERPTVGAQGTPKALADAPWSEPLFNLRIRMAPEKGNEYRHGEQMPLLVELQNVGDAPIKFSDLRSRCHIIVEDEKGKWLGPRSGDIAISPWERSTGSLSPRESVRWTVRFDRLRLNKLVTSSTIQIKIGVPYQNVPDERYREVYCPPSTLKLTNAPFTVGNNPSSDIAKSATDRWTNSMELTYRDDGAPFGRDPSQAIHINGLGEVTLISVDGGNKKLRATTKLSSERLDRLAAFLKQLKIWDLEDVESTGSEAHYRHISLAYGQSTFVGYFATQKITDQPWLRLIDEMRAVIAEAVKQVGVAPQ